MSENTPSLSAVKEALTGERKTFEMDSHTGPSLVEDLEPRVKDLLGGRKKAHMMTGISGFRFFIRDSVSRPDNPGIFSSRKTISKLCFLNCSNASPPFVVVVTS